MTNREQSSELILLQLQVKKLDKWVSYELTANWQITIFLKWSSSVILHNKQVLDWIAMCNEKWILYNNQQPPAQRLHREVPKHFPKPNLHQKNVLVTVWWSAAGLIHYIFLNPSETISSEKYAQQINGMPWKLQHL